MAADLLLIGILTALWGWLAMNSEAVEASPADASGPRRVGRLPERSHGEEQPEGFHELAD